MATQDALSLAEKLKLAAAAAAQVRAQARQTAQELADERQQAQTLPAPIPALPGQAGRP